jgi:hypothetical protein
MQTNCPAKESANPMVVNCSPPRSRSYSNAWPIPDHQVIQSGILTAFRLRSNARRREPGAPSSRLGRLRILAEIGPVVSHPDSHTVIGLASPACAKPMCIFLVRTHSDHRLGGCVKSNRSIFLLKTPNCENFFAGGRALFRFAMTSERIRPTQSRRGYPSDLADREWAIIERISNELDPYTKGRPRECDMRQVLNAVFKSIRLPVSGDIFRTTFLPTSTSTTITTNGRKTVRLTRSIRHFVNNCG